MTPKCYNNDSKSNENDPVGIWEYIGKSMAKNMLFTKGASERPIHKDSKLKKMEICRAYDRKLK